MFEFNTYTMVGQVFFSFFLPIFQLLFINYIYVTHSKIKKFHFLLLFIFFLNIFSAVNQKAFNMTAINSIRPLIDAARQASFSLRKIDDLIIKKVLHKMADALETNRDIILKLNTEDLKNGKAMHLSPEAIERLYMDNDRLLGLTACARAFASNYKQLVLKNDDGLDIPKASLYAVVYESRPYISAEASIQAFAAGHAIVLRGGKEGFHTNTVIVSILGDVLENNGLPRALITLIPTTDRVAMTELISLKDHIDYVIPRGSDGLITYIKKNSKVTVATQLPNVYYK